LARCVHRYERLGQMQPRNPGAPRRRLRAGVSQGSQAPHVVFLSIQRQAPCRRFGKGGVRPAKGLRWVTSAAGPDPGFQASVIASTPIRRRRAGSEATPSCARTPGGMTSVEMGTGSLAGYAAACLRSASRRSRRFTHRPARSTYREDEPVRAVGARADSQPSRFGPAGGRDGRNPQSDPSSDPSSGPASVTPSGHDRPTRNLANPQVGALQGRALTGQTHIRCVYKYTPPSIRVVTAFRMDNDNSSTASRFCHSTTQRFSLLSRTSCTSSLPTSSHR
jgi:hypothetical protein